MKKIALAVLIAVAGTAHANPFGNKKVCNAAVDMMKATAEARDKGVPRYQLVQVADQTADSKNAHDVFILAIDSVYSGKMSNASPEEIEAKGRIICSK